MRRNRDAARPPLSVQPHELATGRPTCNSNIERGVGPLIPSTFDGGRWMFDVRRLRSASIVEYVRLSVHADSAPPAQPSAAHPPWPRPQRYPSASASGDG